MNKILTVEEVKRLGAKLPEDLCARLKVLILKEISIDDSEKYSFCITLEDIKKITGDKYSNDLCLCWLSQIGDILSSDWEVTNIPDKRVRGHFMLKMKSK